MKTYKYLAAIMLCVSCSGEKMRGDAFGNFEAVEIIVSSEADGQLINFDIEEGYILNENQVYGVIDTVQLGLKKQALKDQINSLYAKMPDIATQINVLKERLAKAEYEHRRINELVKTEAATTKQLDDIDAEIKLIKKEMAASLSTLTIQQKGLIADIKPLETQIEIIEYQILKSHVTSPINGTVLTKFAHKGELTTKGRALMKVADLENILFRAYVEETQLSQVKIGDTVELLIDNAQKGYDKYNGTITWVSSKAEFTPKVIQTKSERANQVYAIKVMVKNDGKLKIGMPGEIIFAK